MDSKEAAKVALREVANMFADQSIQNPRLEEYARHGGAWLVTVSFNRKKPSKSMRKTMSALSALSLDEEWDREYKVVTVKDDGTIEAVRNYRSQVA